MECMSFQLALAFNFIQYIYTRHKISHIFHKHRLHVKENERKKQNTQFFEERLFHIYVLLLYVFEMTTMENRQKFQHKSIIKAANANAGFRIDVAFQLRCHITKRFVFRRKCNRATAAAATALTASVAADFYFFFRNSV